MRALVISDTHFGAWTGRDLLAEGAYLERLAPALEGIDELIFLGDLFDFLFGSVGDAVDSSSGLLALIAQKLPGKRLVFLAGNHDHHLVHRDAENRVEALLANGRSPSEVGGAEDGLEPGDGAGPGFFRSFLARRLPGVEVEIAYPTYTFAGVLCTHGHYLDPHARLAGSRGDRLLTRTLWSIATGGPEEPKTLEDYESVITLLTEWLYIAAQMPHGTHAQQNVFRAVQRAGRVGTVLGLPVRGAKRLAARAIERGGGEELPSEEHFEAVVREEAARQRREQPAPESGLAAADLPGGERGLAQRSLRAGVGGVRPGGREPRLEAGGRQDRLRPHPPTARRRALRPRLAHPLLEHRLLDLRARPELASGLRALPALRLARDGDCDRRRRAGAPPARASRRPQPACFGNGSGLGSGSGRRRTPKGARMSAPPDLTALRDGFGGDVLADGDAGYEDARSIFNSMIAKRPAAIAQCESAEDVRAALAFARKNGLEVAVRGGGHSVAGACLTDGGLTIDMRRMNGVTVDPEARTATAQGGATWGDFDAACQPHGLATTGGRVSTTGVAGLTLGGGSGWLERKFGLACDNLLAVELVTADGRTVRAAEDENPELFWALHGGGGNFGVATELTFRLHEMPAFTAALMFWPPDAGPELARAYRELIEAAPDEVGGALIYLTAPPEEFVPESMHEQLAAAILVTYAGPEAEAREAIAPLLALHPAGEMIAELPYAELQSMLDDPPGYRNYWSAEYLDELPDAAIDAFCARAEGIIVPSPTQHIVLPWGGAVARGAADSPLATRESPWVVHPLTLWEDPADDEHAIQWTRDVRADVEPWATGATYLNFVGDEGEDRIVAGYGRENYDRLAAVKAEYDPDGVFHLHHPIQPLAAT